MSNYSDKLKHPEWQRKRLEILKRDDFTCCKCGDKETELHVHHLKYTGEPWDAPNEDLETLCKHCHLFLEWVTKLAKRIPYAKEFNMYSVKMNGVLAVSIDKNVFFLIQIKENELDFDTLIPFDKESVIFNLLTNGNG